MAARTSQSDGGVVADVSVAGTLIPGLTNDVAAVILASLPPAEAARIRSTSHAIRSLLSPPTLLPLRRNLRLLGHPLLAVFPSDPSLHSAHSPPPFLLDPVSLASLPLPLLPLLSPSFYSLSNFSAFFLPPSSLVLLGGSHFDARSFPLGLPSSSPYAFRLDFSSQSLSWRRLPDMLSPRGSFACAASMGKRAIFVAGGGSRHTDFPSHGDRIRSVELFNEVSRQWTSLPPLPAPRAGCVGFLKRNDGSGQDEFWVMGGYGDYRTVSGVVPADVYFRDAVVLNLESREWRAIGDMWEPGERDRLGAVAVVEGEDGRAKAVFMLEGINIFRYNFLSNRWLRETRLVRGVRTSATCGFTAAKGELYVLSSTMLSGVLEPRRHGRKWVVLSIQVYNPATKNWRLLRINLPFQKQINFRTAVVCTIQL